ncbi:hypothetical protein [Nitratidesulfovibrio liaohensis]|uniref:Alpha/beta hydrolase family protein n=1 Tax=Nitratidesulfovibrio liaohensis TaxID=2604158 RepID=A0ABY9R475_9BACT|nr:hypothetical protein [Nitratidesulfovibrio liaohensis]WMW65534.1 hypothetical protein KPS_000010 [Nitratidesulfovibrio liaohensis]
MVHSLTSAPPGAIFLWELSLHRHVTSHYAHHEIFTQVGIMKSKGIIAALLFLFCSIIVFRYIEAKKAKGRDGDLAVNKEEKVISYDYGELKFDVPIDALAMGKDSFVVWQKNFKSQYHNMVSNSWPWSPELKEVRLLEDNEKYKKFQIDIGYEKSCPLFNSSSGGILAIPKVIDSSKPIIIAIHGHERSTWGKHPLDMLDEGQWAKTLVDNGYIVFCPVSMHHEKIKEYGSKSGYLVVWTKIISDYIDCLKNEWTKHPHNGFAVVGLSAGGQISYFLMAYRDDIQKGFFAGANQPLEFMRREYRAKGHPECWDVPAIASYTAIYSLLPPRSVRFYLGKKDPFYPNMEKFPVYPWFDGTKRDVTTDEIYGNFLLLKEMYKIRGGDIDLIIHDGGHELNGQVAADFLN